MRIGVLGAGSIGCYVGGRLIVHGEDVRLVGRASFVNEVGKAGLALSDCDEFETRLEPERVNVSDDVASLHDCDVVLVTVKSRDTVAAADSLKPVIKAGTTVVSLQNGVRNAGEIARALSGVTVVAGMVPFNVVKTAAGVFHRGTSGDVILGQSTASSDIAARFAKAGVPTKVRQDITLVQWGKLLVNLGNAINALAGVPLLEQLGSLGYRRILAAAMTEGLTALKVAKIQPVSTFGPPCSVIPHVLRLPDALFLRLAATMLKVDPTARSSMWEDLDRRRPTEIDYLNGEIVRLAEAHGKTAPLNKRIATLVKGAEAAQAGSPGLSAQAMAAALGI